MRDGSNVAKTEALRDHLALLKFQAITGEEASSMEEAKDYTRKFRDETDFGTEGGYRTYKRLRNIREVGND